MCVTTAAGWTQRSVLLYAAFACRKQASPGLSELLVASPLSCFLHTSLFQKTMCMSSKCLSLSSGLVHADPFIEFKFFLQLLNFGLIC